MSVVLIRSLILYIVVIFGVRLMGKRQLGELQPSELVITILISNIATLPLEDTSIPLILGILPILTLVIVSIGSYMRYTRTNMLEGLNADYIRTARAKGLSEKKVIYKHAFRNTLIPLVTIIGGSLPGLFSGALITETLFSIPGIGYVSYQSMVAGDIPFSMFYLSFMAVLTLASNLLTDILYGVVDPRVRIS